MADITYEQNEKITEIINSSSRLKYLLQETYRVKIDSITGLRVDSDNMKIDINMGSEMIRFKAKGTEDVLAPDPQTKNMTMVLDPALAQAIYAICNEYAL